jgi:hypothetical protein
VLNKEKALLLSQQGFFFVDKRFEISNLSLNRDMIGIVNLEKNQGLDVLVSQAQ